MKCVCGYEYEYEYDDETHERKATIGDEPYIKIIGTFMVENTGYHGGMHEVSLYACPKCQTIRMEDW